MDMTSHAAAVAVPLAAALGLVGLVGVPFRALRQARQDGVLAERAWQQIRAERRQAELAAVQAETPDALLGAGATIGAQRRESTPAVV